MGQSRAPRASRSVSGCLTCRRRKVKCTSASSPCEPCTRLGLSCIASFQQNIRVWSASGRSKQNSEYGRKSPKRTIHEGSSHDLVSQQTPSCRPRSLGSPSNHSPEEMIYDFSERISTPVNDTQPHEVLERDVSTVQSNTFASQDTHANNIDLAMDLSSPIQPWISFDSPLQSHSPIFNSIQFDHNQVGVLNTVPGQNWDIVTWTQYISRVPEWLSTKRSMWSCYHYLINLAQAIPDSPLFHGILSWTYAYLFRLGLVAPEPSRLKHYMTASDSIQLLSSEITDGPVYLNLLVINPSDRLSQYISTTFFLCQHDLIVGNFESFKARIDNVKEIFVDHWKKSILPGTIESRIIIWLAFMELRFILMTDEDATTGKYEKDLMAVLMELEAIPTLRGARRKQSYLIECFGNGLPSEENDEDLRKERCRERYDAIFFYFSKVRSFKAWDQSTRAQINTEPLIGELRDAKIEALRADLGRIHAECKLVTSSQELPTVHESMDSGMFSIMTVKALCLCATIMLNQAVNQSVTTDSQIQLAAHELIRIARIFRKSKRLVSPCSTIWPLPVFFAGIGVADEIYQDWTMDYMKELEQWGAHVVKSRDVMEQLIKLQVIGGCTVDITNIL